MIKRAAPFLKIRNRGLGGCLLASLVCHILLIFLLFPEKHETKPGRDAILVELVGCPPGLSVQTDTRRTAISRLPSGGKRRSRRTRGADEAGSAIKESRSALLPARQVASRQNGGSQEPASRGAGSSVEMSSPLPSVNGASGAAASGNSHSLSIGKESTGVPGDEPVIGGRAAASFLRRAMPVYPAAARRFGQEGAVTLRLTIDGDGGLERVEVVRGAGYGFTEAAIDAVRRSTFSPATKNGRGTPSRTLLRVRFVLSAQ